ncbi:MAG: hypothetical protein IT324_02830 [Anaerolineae bacterium]|nr:hypothetical protein [Anaerolineae bacterium]
MPVEITWYEPESILLVTYSRGVLADEINEVREQLIAYLDAAARPIHIIEDWRASTCQPMRYTMMGRISALARHNNMGNVVIIGINPVLAFWAELAQKRCGLRYLALSSLEEAGNYLRVLNRQTAVA